MKLIRNLPPPLALDLAASRRRPGWLGWVLLACGALALVAEVGGLLAVRADLAEREAIVARLRQAVGERGVAAPAPLADPAAAARLVALLRTDWGSMLAGLANAGSADIGVLEVQADAVRGSLRLRARAPTPDAAFAYAAALGASGVLRDAQVDSHQWIDVDGDSMVDFTASARWGAAP